MIARLRLALALAACATLSPAAALAGDVHVGILPPEGWTRVDAKGTNLLAAWREGSGGGGAGVFYANLTLAHDDTPQPLETYVATTTTKALATSLPGSTPRASKVTICGQRAAFDIVAVGRYGGVKVRIEEIVTDIGGKKFIGTYTRPDASAPSATAETALHSICPQT